ncbi:hypothetical protein ACH4EF_42865, partial [Streptomyces zaomyceticus]
RPRGNAPPRLSQVPVEAVGKEHGVRDDHRAGEVRKSPSIGTDDVLPADQEEAIFHYYGMAYQPGAGGERQLARR